MTEKKKNKINIENLDRKLDFKVPKGYFDELPQSIQKQIIHAPEKNFAQRFFQSPKWIGLSTVSFASIVLVLFIYLNPSQVKTTDPCLDLACVPLEEIKAYYDTEIELIEEEVYESAIDNFDKINLDEFKVIESSSHQLEKHSTNDNSNTNSSSIQQSQFEDVYYDDDILDLEDELLDELDLEDLNDFL